MGLLGTPTIQSLREEGPALIRKRQPSVRDYPDRHYGGGVI
jgi:hypothetical protein